MPTESSQTASSVEDYVGVLESFAAFGIECVVIGGCAVGAYARLVGERVFSADLDLLVTWRSLEMVLADSDAFGVRIEKRPQPRTVPVAVLEWQGREVNLLTGTTGLPPADVVARGAREFHIGGGADRAILIADPFDLLRNKLAVNRAKYQPHIAVLRRFLAEEVVAAFSNEEEPRARIGVAERLLEVLGAQALDEDLARRLVPLAKTVADFRFLSHRAPAALIADLSARAPSEDVRRTIERIARSRGLGI